MPSHLKNTLDAKLGEAMGKSADIPRVCSSPSEPTFGSLGGGVAPMHNTHTTTLPLPSWIAQAGPGTTFGVTVVCQCASYGHTSGLDVHRHKGVQQGWAEMAEMAEQCVGVAVANRHAPQRSSRGALQRIVMEKPSETQLS